jgi:hypothetical protein
MKIERENRFDLDENEWLDYHLDEEEYEMDLEEMFEYIQKQERSQSQVDSLGISWADFM